MKRMRKACGDSIVILAEACLFTLIGFVMTGSAGLAVLTLLASIFLGMLAFLIDELEKRGTLVLPQSQEQAGRAFTFSHACPVLTWNAPGTHQVRTETVIELTVGISDLHRGVRTDVERSRCVPGQHTHTPTNQITYITHD